MSSMQQTKKEIVMYSTTWCPDCRRAKAWFDEHNIVYQDINIEEDEKAVELVQKINNGRKTIPTIIFPDGDILVEPTNNELEAKMQLLQ